LGELGDLPTVARTFTLQDTQTVAVLSGILECPHHDELESKKRAFDTTLFASRTGQRLEPCRAEKLRRQARAVATITIKLPPRRIFWVPPAMMNIGSGDNDCRKQLFPRRVLDTDTASLRVADYEAEIAGFFGNIRCK
jgi:hypothetical protein